ncbi:MAG: aldehyde dehydrogenase family protein [Microbacterium sp.]
MTSPPRTTSPALATDVRARLDAEIAALRTGEKAWCALTLGQRARLLERVRAEVVRVAEEWADTASTIKGLEPGHPLRGEEWLSGPYAVLAALDAYAASLRALAHGHSPLATVETSVAPGGRVVLHTFPTSPVDALLLSGFTAQVWLRPGVTEAQARADAGLAQRTPTAPGGVGLVLGAGNVTAIPVLDVLYELLAHNRVALLKLNPTMDPLRPVFERALAPLVEPGLLAIETGGADVGAHLAAHDGIDHVHITGAEATFDAIVWGAGPTPQAKAAARRRKREGRPLLRKPITAELGGVSPIVVVPGRWSDADLRYQAEHVVTMRLYNSGHNCIAGQVVVLSHDWPQRDAFLAALRDAFARAPQRPVWYPRSDERLAAAATAYPDAEWLCGHTRALVAIGDDTDATALETTEYFAPVLGVVQLPGLGQEFLDAAVAYANDRLAGTLGANVLIDPATERALGDGFERAIADLRYGAVAINAWTAFTFLTPTATWGAYPGNTPDAIGSGVGVVHNGFLVDAVERSVTRGPFRPFPRSARGGERTVLPKPPWFVTSRTGAAVSEGFTRFRMDGDWLRLTRTLAAAFRA